ncbi:MAG: hypothetical protein ACRD2L_22440 [Terriglobia bacterium]
MGKIALNAYLFFAGNCREAMEFYRDIFGTLKVQTYDEVPGQPEPMEGKVIHASLMEGDVDVMRYIWHAHRQIRG